MQQFDGVKRLAAGQRAGIAQKWRLVHLQEADIGNAIAHPGGIGIRVEKRSDWPVDRSCHWNPSNRIR